VSVTTVEKLSKNGKRVLGVLGSPPRKGRFKRVQILLGGLSAPAGSTRAVVVSLNPTGRQLRKRFKKLPGQVTVTGSADTTVATIRTANVTFGPDPAKLRLVGRPKIKHGTVTLKLRCVGLRTQRCRGTGVLTTVVPLPKGGTGPIQIGNAGWNLRVGKRGKLVTVRLNSTGRRLLARSRRIRAQLTISTTYAGYTIATIKRSPTLTR
jgi:hypothetical protein